MNIAIKQKDEELAVVKQAYEKDSFVDRQTSELNIENLKKTFKEQVERHRT